MTKTSNSDKYKDGTETAVINEEYRVKERGREHERRHYIGEGAMAGVGRWHHFVKKFPEFARSSFR
jgi:hypothetical protein